jgi:hypothetical protein
MYGTLGYIDNGRRTATRDSGFLGATSNPARRDFYGAVRRPEPPSGTAANTLALLERRCIFLEEQDKRRMAEVADLRARLNDARVETVHATVLSPTTQAREVEPSPQSVDRVPEGQRVQLQYPMKRVRSGDVTQVWMRRREVDPDLAAVDYRWILLFEEREGAPDRVLVGKFE